MSLFFAMSRRDKMCITVGVAGHADRQAGRNLRSRGIVTNLSPAGDGIIKQ
ncbi:MAG: hypothetical protein LBN74_07965 [Prevotella sp.]|nr:hypothetical protein [Prevotella sp.]